MGVTPPPTFTSYRKGVPANRNVTIYSDDSCMGVPPTTTSYRGRVPASQNVTINNDDSFMVVPPPLLRHIGGYLPIKMIIYIAMTHACA